MVRDVQFAGASTVLDAVDASSGTTELRLRLPGGRTGTIPAVGETVALMWSDASAVVMDADPTHVA